MIWLSVAAILCCVVTALVDTMHPTGVMLTAFLFGATSFPIYSVAAAHANDFATSEQRVELSAALMFYFAIGAIAAPFVASSLIDWYGPQAMFLMIASAHGLLIFFSMLRMLARPTLALRTRYVWAPRTSFTIGRLTKTDREPKAGP